MAELKANSNYKARCRVKLVRQGRGPIATVLGNEEH